MMIMDSGFAPSARPGMTIARFQSDETALRRAAAGKNGRPLLQERVHAFGVVGRKTRFVLRVAFELELRVEIVAPGVIEHALDQRERHRRRCGEACESACACAISSASSSTFQINPHASALSAGRGSAVSARPRARAGPTSRGNNPPPPQSGVSPIFANARTKLAPPPPQTKSQATATLGPAPPSTPLT